MDLSSKLLSNAVDEISKLPGIGKSTALRLALHLVNKEEGDIDNLLILGYIVPLLLVSSNTTSWYILPE